MKTLLDTQTGTVLQYGNQFITETVRRGFMDRTHRIMALVDTIEEAKVYEEVPTDFENYCNLDAGHFFKNAKQLQVTVKTYREVILKTEVEIH